MLICALEKLIDSDVLLLTVVVVLLVSVENQPETRVAIETVNAINKTDAISGLIPFILFLLTRIRKPFANKKHTNQIIVSASLLHRMGLIQGEASLHLYRRTFGSPCTPSFRTYILLPFVQKYCGF